MAESGHDLERGRGPVRAIRSASRSPVLREVGRVAPVRPSLPAALRALVATGVPLLAAYLLGEPGLVWAATGGFVGALVDAGGSYRARAANLGAVALAGAAAGALGAALGHSLPLAVLGMLLWGGAGAFLRVYGSVGTNAGLTSSVTFAVSLAMPVGAGEALARGGWLLAGGAWAAALVLLIWPLRPHLPVRAAVARCYRALGAYADEIARLAERGGGEHGAAGRGFDAVRQALEEGWSAFGARARWSARGRRTASTERLLVLLEAVDRMLGALFPLADVVERLPDAPPRASLVRAARELAEFASALAPAVARGGRGAPPPPTWSPLELEAAASEEERAALRHAEELVGTLREFANGAAEVVAGASRPPGSVPPPQAARGPGEWLRPVREHLSGESVLLRHALRVGVTAAVGVALSAALRLEHGHWVTLTILFILQPSGGLTLVKGMQRVVGTVLGGVVAALVPRVLLDPAALLAAVALLAAAAVATFRVNYAVFAFFVTPTFVLLAELQAGTWDLAGTRVVDTLIGGALAVAGARLLWSVPERRSFPGHAAAALRAVSDYLRAVARGGGEAAEALAARRRLGLAIIEASESFQRLTLEEGGEPRAVEAQHAVVVYLRRLGSAAVALGTAPPADPAERAVGRRFAATAAEALSSLAEAVAEGRAPPPLPPLLGPELRSGPVRLQLERLDRPIRVLHDAAAATASAGPRAAAPGRSRASRTRSSPGT